MKPYDNAARANHKLWEGEVAKGCGYTTPWLDLDLELLREYAKGLHPVLPEPLTNLYPPPVFANLRGKSVLCLAAGGGQQSAVFGLLGAKVTVADLAAGQLTGDHRAAEHYGYPIQAIQADMRDLSALEDQSFDLVYQANSMAYVPDVKPVFTEVARVLKKFGTYRVVFGNPAAAAMQWDGENYVIGSPYSQMELPREDGGLEFRHTTAEIFNGLLETGFSISQVLEEPYYQVPEDAPPGSWNHERAFVGGGFIILAQWEDKGN